MATLAACILGAILVRSSTADPGSGANAVEYRAMCDLLQAATAAPPQPLPAGTWKPFYQSLLDANMSIANPQWQGIFVKSDGTPQEYRGEGQSNPHPKEWKEQWPEWAATALRVAKSGQSHGHVECSGVAKLSASQRAAAALRVQHIINTTTPLVNQLKKLDQELEAAKPESINKPLQKAVYGANKQQTDFEGGSGSKQATRTKAMCSANGKGGEVGTVADVLLCLCVPDNGEAPAGAKQLCNKKGSNHVNQDWSLSTKAHVKSTFDELYNGCGIKAEQPTSAQRITAALTALQSHIKIFKTAGYLGAVEDAGDGSCDGSATNGACVKFKLYSADGRGGIAETDWAKELISVAQTLETAHRAASASEGIITQLKAAATQAWLVPAELLTAAALATTQTKAQGDQPETQRAREEKDKECNAAGSNKTAEECNKLGCDHDEKKNKCKPKTAPGTENKAAGTGDETKEGAAATPNCASHTEKTKCEAENTGKSSPVCGWRKGKDGEPDQDKEMCRNGSFLLNKKFALSVVSAAFVALLF